MFVGVDVGGTKTEAIAVDTHGEIRARVTAGSGNWEGIGLPAAAHLYADLIERLLAVAHCSVLDITAHAWGVAGLDWPSDDNRLRPLIAPLIPHAPCMLVNDAFLPLRAGSRFSYGVGVIAGTGSTVAGIGRSGAQYRTFGLGSMWGDFDGAQGIAYAAFQQLARAYYRNQPPSPLLHAMLAWSGYSSLPAVAEALSRDEFTQNIDTFAPVVMHAADAGDEIACTVISAAASLLAENAGIVAAQLDLTAHEFDVVLAGGVATGAAPIFHTTFARALAQHAPHATVQTLNCRPVVGAVLLAADISDTRLAPTLQSALASKELQ